MVRVYILGPPDPSPYTTTGTRSQQAPRCSEDKVRVLAGGGQGEGKQSKGPESRPEVVCSPKTLLSAHVLLLQDGKDSKPAKGKSKGAATAEKGAAQNALLRCGLLDGTGSQQGGASLFHALKHVPRQ